MTDTDVKTGDPRVDAYFKYEYKNANQYPLTYANIIELQKNKEVVLGYFEEHMLSKKQAEKEEFVNALKHLFDYDIKYYLFYTSGYCSGHKEIKKRFMELGLSEEDALATMVAYNFTSVQEGEALQNNILNGKVRDLLIPDPTREEWLAIRNYVIDMGQAFILKAEKYGLFQEEYKGHQEEAHRAMWQQFQMMPPNKRQKVRHLIQKGMDMARQTTLDKGVNHMVQTILPLFFADCTKAQKGNRAQKIKKTKENLYIFGFMFLAKNGSNPICSSLNYLDIQKQRAKDRRDWEEFCRDPHPCYE